MIVRIKDVRARRSLGPPTVGLAVVLLAATAALALPPIDPLPLPTFSLDPESPAVLSGQVEPRDILTLDNGELSVVVPGGMLGLMSPYDDLDALSGPNSWVQYNETFVLLFTVDRGTVGMAVPNQNLIDLGVPYSVTDQATRGHAAGDQFAAVDLRSLGGIKLGRGTRGGGTTLVRNNYDEGGTDFSCSPPTHAHDAPGAVPQDNVNATGEPTSTSTRRDVSDVYFSINAMSPTLPALSSMFMQPPSGAHIFYNAHPDGMTETALYASATQLGLQLADDIDGVVIFDWNETAIFDLGDVALFTLEPNSPSLATIPGASFDAPAGDVFIMEFGQTPAIYAPASEFDLGNPADNMNGLHFAPCPDELLCAELHGIRSVKGDLNCDGVADVFDIDAFVMAITDPAMYHAMFPDCNIENGDCNQDFFIDVFDIDAFVAILTGT